MKSELPVSADALLAERARLEEELQSSDDWRELLHLKSRKDRGDNAVSSARLEMVLLDALAEDAAFVRYKAVCVALERLIRGLPVNALPPRSKPVVAGDDLTRIKGIDQSLAKRLAALGVTTFAQIAEWQSSDIKEISAELGLGRQIYSQDWLDQAARLADDSYETEADSPPPKPAPVVQAAPLKVVTPPVPPKFVPASAAVVSEPVLSKVSEPSPQSAVAFKPAPNANMPTPGPAPVGVKPAEAKQAPISPVAPPPVVTAPPSAIKAEPDVAASIAKMAAIDQGGKSLGAEIPVSKAPEAKIVETSSTEKPPEKSSQPSPTSGPATSSAGGEKPGATAKPNTSALDVAKPLPTPPRPLVVTKASLPREQAAAPIVVPAASSLSREATPTPAAAKPSQPSPTATSTSNASPAGSAPASMTINEAIAYAAEVARQGPRAPGADGPELRASSPRPQQWPQNAAKPAVSRSPVTSVSTSRNDAAPAVVPPPLPAGFKPPDAPQANLQSNGSDTSRVPDEHAAYRMNIEEATVEIVRRSAVVAPPPKVALSAVVKETAVREPRAATPIGRFLKALTGN